MAFKFQLGPRLVEVISRNCAVCSVMYNVKSAVFMNHKLFVILAQLYVCKLTCIDALRVCSLPGLYNSNVEIWMVGRCSEFGDIFDVEHFRETLRDDVRIVSSVPSTHIMFRPLEEKETPLNASPRWLRAHYRRKVITKEFTESTLYYFSTILGRLQQLCFHCICKI